MTREIKFRAFDKETGDMFYTDDGNGFIFCISPVGGHWVMDNKDRNIDQNFTEWMQYTGLKDKNGKEIYQGDILQYKSEEEGFTENYEVVWDEKQACFATRIFINRPIFAHFNTGYLEDQTPATDLENVGNIYENPELLAAKSA